MVWWRIALPRSHTLTLLIIFGATYLSAFLSSSVWNMGFTPGDVWERAHFTLFFVPAALTYISLYSLLEQKSPSLSIIERLAQAKAAGCSREQLAELFPKNDIIEQRLMAAEGNGLLRRIGDQWQLTVKGRFFARLFDIAATTYRFPKAG